MLSYLGELTVIGPLNNTASSISMVDSLCAMNKAIRYETGFWNLVGICVLVLGFSFSE